MTLPFSPEQRRVPVIPPAGERLRVLIDSDAKNEIDDLWAIALAILSPERFAIEGFIGANFDNERGGAESVRRSVEEIETLLAKAGMAGQWPVLPGSDPMQYQFVPTPSEGVDFLIERAMASTPEDPLWVIGLGAATDIACAYLKEPRIAERVVVFWHLRTRWPDKCWNFNVFGDVRAVRLLFHSPLPFVLFDTGGHLFCSMEESEARVRPYGALGEYLHEYRHLDPDFAQDRKGFFDLGDIAALLEPDSARWEVTACPAVDWDLSYQFRGTLGSILRCADVDRDRSFTLLYDKLREHFLATAPEIRQHTTR